MTPLFWFSLLALLLVYMLYQDYGVDRYRQSLFNLRDRLFDLARAGRIPFDSPIYGLLRTTINGHIRFAHRIRFLWFVFYSTSQDDDALRRAGIAPFSDRYEEAVASLDGETRREVEATLGELHTRTMNHMALISVPMLLFCFVVGVLALTIIKVRRWSEALKVKTNAVFDSTGMLEGGSPG